MIKPLQAGAAIMAVLALTLVGCSETQTGADDADPDPATVESCGREVTFEQAPESVLAIGVEAPSLLDSAGAGESITHYAGPLSAPFEPQTRAVVDSAENIIDDPTAVTFEMIVNTGVDAVIGTDITAGLDLDDLAARLERAGITLFTITGYCAGVDGRTTDGRDGFDMIYGDIETLGRIFDTNETAERSIAELKDRVSATVDSVDGDSGRTSVALYVPPEGPVGAYGNEALVSEQMSLLGLENIFDGVDKRYFEPSTEALVQAEPEVIVAAYLPTATSRFETDDDVVDAVRSRPELKGIDAINSEDNLIALDYNYTSPGPLAVTGLEILAERVNGS